MVLGYVLKSCGHYTEDRLPHLIRAMASDELDTPLTHVTAYVMC